MSRAVHWMALLGLAAYLSLFVGRGWIPHDEGTLGQNAERVLAGQLPHVDFNEPYTGGLSFIYASVFAVAGVDLLHLRHLLFVVAVGSTVGVYLIARRSCTCNQAVGVAGVALVWSFPNYFAGLPSWWLLGAAVLAAWCLFRYLETGRLVYAASAGFAVGCSVVVKQTGVYLVAAVLMALLATSPSGGRASPALSAPAWLRLSTAAIAVAAVTVLMGARIGVAEALYLLLPLITVAVAMCRLPRRGPADLRAAWPAVLAGLCALLPLALLSIPYVWHGETSRLLWGAFVAPRERFVRGSRPLPPAGLWLLGLVAPMLFLSHVATRRTPPKSVLVTQTVLASALVIASCYSVLAYQVVMQGARTLATLLPCAALLIPSARTLSDQDAGRRFVLASLLALASLVQFPFFASIYFAYVTPLIVLLGTSTYATHGRALLPILVLFGGFGLVVLNRGDLHTFGAWHAARGMVAPLDLPRANLRVNVDEQVTYRRMTALVQAHLGDGPLTATPDCPEVYFLNARFNRAGRTFEFLGGPAAVDSRWSDSSVIVINHAPDFSSPIDASTVEAMRRSHPFGEVVGAFEVRWR